MSKRMGKGMTEGKVARLREARPSVNMGHLCPQCGKVCYPSRKAAKNAQRKVFPGNKMIAYSCGDYWHLGHANYLIRRGVISRNEVTDSGKYKYRVENR